MRLLRYSKEQCPVHLLDDGSLMRIFSFLTPLPDRFNAARVCRRWHVLASDKRMWLRVDKSMNSFYGSCVFSSIQDAVSAARPGDTIVISSGAPHTISNIDIDKPLCLVGDGMFPEETLLVCPRGSDSALEFSASGKVANLAVVAELGNCFLHKKGFLTIEGCALRCGNHPLEHLSCAIVSTADPLPCSLATRRQNGVFVMETKIEGGKGAVRTSGGLVLQEVRVMYTRTEVLFWFNVLQKRIPELEAPRLASCV